MNSIHSNCCFRSSKYSFKMYRFCFYIPPKKLLFISALFVSLFIYHCIVFNFQSIAPPMNNYRNENRQTTFSDRDASQISKVIQYWNGKRLFQSFPGTDNYIEFSTKHFHLNSSVKRNFNSLLIDISAYHYPINIPKCSSHHNVFVGIFTAPGYFEKRKMIRQTWSHNLNSSYVFAFLVGLTKDAQIQRKIEEESVEHGDIIQINFIDDYKNLTLKVVGLFNWLNDYCPQISYLMKCDDDVYVNVLNLSDFIEKSRQKNRSFMGLSITIFRNVI